MSIAAVLAACATVAGSGPDVGAPLNGAAADAETDAAATDTTADAATWCRTLGGACEPFHGGTSPALFCADVPGAFILSLDTACAGVCCITPDGAGDLPSQLRGYGACGNVVCLSPAGATCRQGTDSVGCDQSSGGLPDAGADASTDAEPCGLVACAPPLRCTDLARSRCTAP